MGYDVIYEGRIEIDKPLDDDTTRIINGLSDTSRMTWNATKLEQDGIALVKEIGKYGEFFFMDGLSHKEKNELVRKYVIRNVPPSGQPSDWGVWVVTQDRMGLIWNRDEKSYAGSGWLSWINNVLLLPRGYHANGTINWLSELDGKFHTTIKDDHVLTHRGYSKNHKKPDVDAWYQECIDGYEAYHQKWFAELDKNKIKSLGKRGEKGKEYAAFNLFVNDNIIQVNYSNSAIISASYLYFDIVKENSVYSYKESEQKNNAGPLEPDRSTLQAVLDIIEKYIADHPDYLDNEECVCLY